MSFSLKFLPIKDLIFSVVPTIGTYLSYLEGLSTSILPNKFMAITIGLLASILLAIVFYTENVRTYKKSLAEILATGYFMNFTGKLGTLLKSKTPISFIFPNNKKKSFNTDQILVEIGIPKSLNSLISFSEQVESDSDIIYVDNSELSEPFWLRGKVTDQKLTIFEFPRTLFSIPKYLKNDFNSDSKAEKKSKKIFAYFNDKINKLRIENSQQIPTKKLKFKMV
ncbi:MAG: hypothetical protein HKO81_03060 [Flavobacteriaceae bacterium]|nr:hypothetical protein [Bacteroidia bacterium]NNL15603.1 hypothetical protein [Flavobacteriaceae bacterium]